MEWFTCILYCVKPFIFIGNYHNSGSPKTIYNIYIAKIMAHQGL